MLELDLLLLPFFDDVFCSLQEQEEILDRPHQELLVILDQEQVQVQVEVVEVQPHLVDQVEQEVLEEQEILHLVILPLKVVQTPLHLA